MFLVAVEVMIVDLMLCVPGLDDYVLEIYTDSWSFRQHL